MEDGSIIMKKFKWGKRKMLKVVLIVILLIVIGIGGYVIYSLHMLDKLSVMTFEEMLVATTKDNKDAVITVGIIQNGNMTYKVYGENGIELPPEEHIYEIGSITKTFTTSLLCKAISEGKVSLDDPIDKYLSLPQKDYYPTIRRLVTHTSGYKSHYFEKPMISNTLHGENSFYEVSEKMLLKRLGKINIEDTNYPFKYSNFGISTVGGVLEQIYDKDYTQLMNEYILEDLGLLNTKISNDFGDLDNYWKWSKSDAYIPAGAILSNITDMMQYVNMHMEEKLGYLSIAHNELVKVNFTNKTYNKMGIHINAVGTGWMIDKDRNIIWHNGGTGDYNSYAAFNKEKQIGVVVLSNLSPSYRIPATVMGIEVLTSLTEK